MMKRIRIGIGMTLATGILNGFPSAIGQNHASELEDITRYLNGKIQINNLQYSMIDHAPSVVFKDQNAYETFKESFRLEDYLQAQQKICCLSYDSDLGNFCYKEIAKEDFDKGQLHARSGLFLGKSGHTWWNGQPRGFTVLENSPTGNTVENGITNTFFSGVSLDATLFVHLGLGDFQRGSFQTIPLNQTQSKWHAATDHGNIYGLLESKDNIWSLLVTNEHQERSKKVLFQWDNNPSRPQKLTVVDPETDQVFQHYITFESENWWKDFEASFSYGYHTNTTDAILLIGPQGKSKIQHGGKIIDSTSAKSSIRPFIIMAFLAILFVVVLNITKTRKD